MRPRGNQISRGSVLLGLAVAIVAMVIFFWGRSPKYEIPDYTDVPSNMIMPYGDGRSDVSIGSGGASIMSMQSDKQGDIGPQLSPEKAALNNKLTYELRQQYDYNSIQ